MVGRPDHLLAPGAWLIGFTGRFVRTLRFGKALRFGKVKECGGLEAIIGLEPWVPPRWPGLAGPCWAGDRRAALIRCPDQGGGR